MDFISVEKQVKYNKEGAKPAVKVTFGNGKESSVLREGVDYPLIYSKNRKINPKAKVK